MCFAYDTSVQASTGYSPFYLMFGRQARLLIDLMYGGEPEATLENVRKVPDYVFNLKKSPGTYTQLIEDEEPMAATEPHIGHDDNPEVAGGNIPPFEQLDTPPVEPEAAVPRRYPERQLLLEEYETYS